MLSFQRLEVYQRSIEFFAHALEIIDELPSKDTPRSQTNCAAPPSRNLSTSPRSRPDIAKHYTIARSSAMERAAILDVMKIRGTLKP